MTSFDANKQRAVLKNGETFLTWKTKRLWHLANELPLSKFDKVIRNCIEFGDGNKVNRL